MKGGNPFFETAGPTADGRWRIRLAIYRKPLRVYAFGHWLIGRPW